MSFSHSFLSERKRQIENLSKTLVGQRIKVIVDNTETLLFVTSIINRNLFHHYSSELLFECQRERSDTTIVEVELWFFAYAGKYRLFQPLKNRSFDVLGEDELRQII